MTAIENPKVSNPLCDISSFPLVRLRTSEASELGYTERWIAEMNALLDRQEPFVLVVNGMQEEESQEERKQRAIWFKHNRERLGRYCRGNIFITEADSLRQQLQLRAAKMSNSEAFPFRVAIVATEAEALAQAQQLLVELKHS